MQFEKPGPLAPFRGRLEASKAEKMSSRSPITGRGRTRSGDFSTGAMDEEPEAEPPGGSPSPYEVHLDLIEGVIGWIARRRCLSEDEGEDFSSWVRIRLLEDECAILRKFQGRSSFRTYLVTVVQNLFRDYRIAKWGKFRPSAQARRLGTTAIRLEILMVRDGIPFEEAAEILRRNHGVEESTAELARLAGELPPRAPTRTSAGVGDEELLDSLSESAEATGPAGPEERLRDRERSETEERVEAGLRRALRALEPEDRLILKMHFEDGFTVAAVARTLGLEQKPLYRRIGRSLRTLRAQLEAAGVGPEAASDLLGWRALSIRVEYET